MIIATTKNMQLVLISLKEEKHITTTQFIRIESGELGDY